MSIDSQRLVELAYAAALEDHRWEAWIQAMVAELKGKASSFYILGSGENPIERITYEWPNERIIDEYFSGMGLHDPLVPQVLNTRQARLVLSQDHLRDDDPATVEYMAWQRGVGNIDHHANIVVPVSGGRWAGLAILFETGQGPLVNGELAGLRAILPDLARAIRLGFDHNEMLDEAFWNGVAGRSSEMAVLLNENGRVIRTTSSAEDLFRKADGLRLTDGWLGCSAIEDDPALYAMIQNATAEIHPRSNAMQIRRPSGKRSLIAIAYPIPRKRRMLAPHDAAALIRIVDRQVFKPGSNDRLVSAFCLTKRESDLAGLLLAGHSVESAAAVLEIALPTTRIHLRNLFAKTGTSRQAELMVLLAQMS